SAIMRALVKIENIFADAPRRPLRINFAITGTSISSAGGGTEPQIARRDWDPAPYELPKLRWSASDFGGIAAGKKAASSKFEAVWRDKKNIVPEYAEGGNGFVGVCDGTVVLSNKFVSQPSMYKGESIDGFKDPNAPYHVDDLETVIMHEVFHIIFYHAHNENYDENGEGLTALDVYMSHIGDPTKRLLYGNFIPDTQGQIVSEAAKKYLGYYPPLQPGYVVHPNMEYGIGAFVYMNGWDNDPRRFVDFELAMLEEMGWNINPAAWKNKK
ncbi:MAG: hypothetical protein RR277_03965, partial [Rikenellaceae bacterium]